MSARTLRTDLRRCRRVRGPRLRRLLARRRPARRKRTEGRAEAEAVDDLEGRRLARAAAAVQVGARVPQPEVQPPAADRPLPRQRPALRRRAGRRAVLVRQQAGREGRALLRPAQGAQDARPDARARRGSSELYGLVFHPKFEKNRHCYVCYTLRAEGRRSGEPPDGTRVSRFTVTKTDPPRIDPASEEIVLTFLAGRAQRRRPALRPRRHALHLHRRRRRPEPARPAQHRPGHLRPALVDPAHRRGPQGRRARTTRSRRTTRSSA